MIDQVGQEAVNQLAEGSDGPWVTIQTPTQRTGQSQAARIQCKNLLAEARRRMEALDVNRLTIKAIEDRAALVFDDAPLWNGLEQSLVMFLSADGHLVARLAEPCEELVIVDDRPHAELLADRTTSENARVVLAISLQKVRLLRGDEAGLREDDPPALPTDIDSALAYDDREQQLQSHASGRVGGGRTTASFHGQGTNREADIDRFMRIVDHALRAEVPGNVPVVLAGVDRTVTAFRKVSQHPGLVETSISGNADRLSTTVLAQRANEILGA